MRANFSAFAYPGVVRPEALSAVPTAQSMRREGQAGISAGMAPGCRKTAQSGCDARQVARPAPSSASREPRIGVTFVTDAQGLELARHAIASFLLSQTDRCHIYLHCDGFTPPPDPQLAALAQERGQHLSFITVERPEYAAHGQIAHMSATRLMKLAAITPLIQRHKRVFYADIDTLFFAPIDLEGFDFRGQPLAAAYDVAETCGLTDPEFRANCHANGLSADYFNSGIMMFDSAQIDLPALVEGYDSLLEQHGAGCGFKRDCKTDDQCVWNLLFCDAWTAAPLDWNMQATLRFTRPWARAAVRHYTGPKKFLPLASWRSDPRESRLIAQIGPLLGTEPARHHPFAPAIYRLNAMRNAARTGRMERAYQQTVARAEARDAAVAAQPTARAGANAACASS